MAQQLTKAQRIRIRDYKREIKNLRSRVKRAEKAGVFFDTDVVSKYKVQGVPTKRDIQAIKSVRGRELYQYGSIFIPTDEGVTRVSGQRAINVLTSQRAQKAAATRGERETDPDKWLRGFLRRNEVISYGISEDEKEEFKRKHSQGWADKLIAQNWLSELQNFIATNGHPRESFSDVIEEPDVQESIWHTESEPEPGTIIEKFIHPDTGEEYEVINGEIQLTPDQQIAWNFRDKNPEYSNWTDKEILDRIKAIQNTYEDGPIIRDELDLISQMIWDNFNRKSAWLSTGEYKSYYTQGTYADWNADKELLINTWDNTIYNAEKNGAINELRKYAIQMESNISELINALNESYEQTKYNAALTQLYNLLRWNEAPTMEDAQRFGEYLDEKNEYEEY